MDYEKLYNETLSNLQEMVSKGKITEEVAKGICADFVAESDDEKIRKELIEYHKAQAFLDGKPKNKHVKYVDWLEKQGNQKLIDKIQIGKIYKCIASPRYSTFVKGFIYKPEDKFLCSLINFYSDCFEPIEEVELNHTDKVEPKFKVGDWVVWDNKISCHVDIIYQGKNSLMYTITDTNNMTRSYSVKGFDNNAHLWTIEDAKDGDVLCTKNKCCPFIYDKGRYNNGLAYYYSGIDVSGNLNIKSPHNMLTHFGRLDNTRPATQEQRDILFKKMKEAGYEWDADKKELKKIEQKHAIEMKTPEESLGVGSDTYNKIVDECVYGEHKSAWSEDDEIMLQNILECLKNGWRILPTSILKYESWLKFFKDRVLSQATWKPSGEQMKFLHKYAEQNNYDGAILTSLYNDLKQLKTT